MDCCQELLPYFLMVFLIIADNQELNKELRILAATRKDDIGSSAPVFRNAVIRNLTLKKQVSSVQSVVRISF